MAEMRLRGLCRWLLLVLLDKLRLRGICRVLQKELVLCELGKKLESDSLLFAGCVFR